MYISKCGKILYSQVEINTTFKNRISVITFLLYLTSPLENNINQQKILNLHIQYIHLGKQSLDNTIKFNSAFTVFLKEMELLLNLHES